jgi:hypothetical protein
MSDKRRKLLTASSRPSCEEMKAPIGIGVALLAHADVSKPNFALGNDLMTCAV